MADIPVVSDHFQFNKQTRIVSWYVPEKFKPGFVVYPTTWQAGSVADFGWIYPYTSCATYICPGANNAHLTCIVPEPNCSTPIPVISTPNTSPTSKEVITRVINKETERPKLLHGGKYFGDVNVPIRTVSGGTIQDELGNTIYSHTIIDDIPRGSTIDWRGFAGDYLVIEGPKNRYIPEIAKDKYGYLASSVTDPYGSGELAHNKDEGDTDCDCLVYCAETSDPNPEDVVTCRKKPDMVMNSANVLHNPPGGFPEVRDRFNNNIWYKGTLIAIAPNILAEATLHTPGCRGVALTELPVGVKYSKDIGDTSTDPVKWLIAVVQGQQAQHDIQIQTFIKPLSYALSNVSRSSDIFDAAVYQGLVNTYRTTGAGLTDIIAEYAKWHKVSHTDLTTEIFYDGYGPVLFNASGTEAVSCFGWPNGWNRIIYVYFDAFASNNIIKHHETSTTGVMKYTINLAGADTTTDLSLSSLVTIDPTWRVNNTGTHTASTGGTHTSILSPSTQATDYDGYVVAADYIEDLYVEATLDYHLMITNTNTEVVTNDTILIDEILRDITIYDNTYTQDSTESTTINTPWRSYSIPEYQYSSTTHDNVTTFGVDADCPNTVENKTKSISIVNDRFTSIRYMDIRNETIIYEYETSTTTSTESVTELAGNQSYPEDNYTVTSSTDKSGSVNLYIHTKQDVDSIVDTASISVSTDTTYSEACYFTPSSGSVCFPVCAMFNYYGEYSATEKQAPANFYESKGTYAVVDYNNYLTVSTPEASADIAGPNTSYNYSSKATELGMSMHEYLGLDSATPIDQIALRGLCLI